MKRILIVHPGATLGGGSLAAIQSAELARADGHTPLLVFNAEGPAAIAARERGLEVRIAPVPRWFCGFEGSPRGLDPRLAVSFVRHYRASVRMLTALIHEHGIDLVYANTSPAVTAIMAARQAGVPVLCHVRETLNRRRAFGRAHIRFIEKHADLIVASSDYAASVFTRRTDVIRIHDGLPLPQQTFAPEDIHRIRAAWGFAPTDRVVGIVGAVNTIKGHYFFMPAIPGIHRRVSNARFVFIGSKLPAAYHRSLRGRLRRLFKGENLDADAILQRLKVSSLVHFTGWIDHVPLAMAACDVIVFPSIIAEGFGRPIVEAGLNGKPVVAFDTGPARELIRDGETGLIVPLKDRAALESAIARLLADPVLAQRLGAHGRRYAGGHFTEDHYAAELRGSIKLALTLQRNKMAPHPSAVGRFDCLQLLFPSANRCL